jgi:hypothetical protein
MIEQGVIDKPVGCIAAPFIQRLFLHAPTETKRFYRRLDFVSPPAEFHAWKRPPYSLMQMDV